MASPGLQAIILIDVVIVVIFAWAQISGINTQDGKFNITLLAASLAIISGLIATWSYFTAKEKLFTSSTLTAYLISMASVVILIYQTGGPQSVFIALWMAIAIFAGVFGTLLIVIIAITLIVHHRLFIVCRCYDTRVSVRTSTRRYHTTIYRVPHVAWQN